MKCWGDNVYGKLGHGTITDTEFIPVDVIGLPDSVLAVAAGGNHTCVILYNFRVYCWGRNDVGQLGDGTNNDSVTPVEVTALTDGAVAIAAGYSYTCVITTFSAVKCWGSNDQGQLGDGTNTDSNTPVGVSGLSGGVTALAAKGWYSCAIVGGGPLKCWGQNILGQLGDGSTENRNTPVDVVGLGGGVTAVSVGFAHTCAITTGGGLKCWGLNNQGQLGNGTRINELTPIDVIGLGGLAGAIKLGGRHTCAIIYSTGAVKCWGENEAGQVGNNSVIAQLSPVNVTGLTGGAAALSMGSFFSCALMDDGGVKCWGTGGLTGDGTDEMRLTPVSVVGLIGTFEKYSPVDEAETSGAPTLSWEDIHAFEYKYCIDMIDNDSCDNAWWFAHSLTSVQITGMFFGETYYWQVLAIEGEVAMEADEGDWWSFVPLYPSAFGKVEPADGSTQGPEVGFLWGDSALVVQYEFCFDTTDDDACSTTWENMLTSNSAIVPELPVGSVIYWQVRAVNSQGTVEADEGAWWHIHIVALPEDFAKAEPDYLPGLVLLSWEASGGALGYEYCYDTTDDYDCDASWVSTGSSTGVTLGSPVPNTEYYWQVRAVNTGGSTEADNGVWGEFILLPPPEAFGKISPGNDSPAGTDPELAWNESNYAVGYEYCYDTIDNNSCDTAWETVISGTSVFLHGLSPSATYYWQVRAVNSTGSIEADGGTWWKFHGDSGLPGPFGKTSPANGATVSTSPTLSWEEAPVTENYEYCLDTTDNDVCDGSWESTGLSTSAGLTDLPVGTTYYWQVRAGNFTGSTYADGGAWWSFTTQIAPPIPFAKLGPANGGSTTASPTIFWEVGSGAYDYEYCYDTTDNGICDSSWTATALYPYADLSGLTVDETYYWQVRALGDGGITYADGGTWWSFTVQSGLPEPFGKISPADGSTDVSFSPTISWESSLITEAYQYCYDTTNNNVCDGSWSSAGLSTNADLSGLTPGTTYYWQVRAGNFTGTTYADGGTWWSFTVQSGLPEPFGKISPANGAANVSFSPTISWEEALIAEAYQYCVDTTDNDVCDGSWESTGFDTSAALSGLASGTTYYWQVRAGNFTGTTYADGGAWWSFTTQTSVPAAFGKSSPPNTDYTTTHPALSWGASSGATWYEYCYDTFDNDVCDTSWNSAGSATSAGLTGLSTGTTYYWQVRAVNGGGTTYANSGTWWSFLTVSPPAAFGKLTPVNGSFTSTSPRISWEDSSGAFDYEYCVDTSNDDACDGSWAQTGLYTYVDLSGLANDTAYYWQVRAVGDGGTTYSDDGAWWSFTARIQTFADVPVNHWAWSYIETLFASGITGGCATSPLRFCPTQTVTRAQMAIFLERGMNGSAYTPPAATGTVFGDVPISYWAAAWIEKLYADGITGGCGGGNYCPDQTVTRAQMAIFLLRAEHGSSYTPPAATGTVFGDVPVSHWAGAWIEQLSAEGITGGCGGGNFCPNQAVTRAEMAIFLVRTFSLP